MRLQEDYAISKIGNDSFLVPIGAAIVDMSKMMDLNDVSLFIVEQLEKNDLSFDELSDKIYDEFEADIDTIKTDLEEFINHGKSIGFIVE